jgi:hypothetical protein
MRRFGAGRSFRSSGCSIFRSEGVSLVLNEHSDRAMTHTLTGPHGPDGIQSVTAKQEE